MQNAVNLHYVEMLFMGTKKSRLEMCFKLRLSVIHINCLVIKNLKYISCMCTEWFPKKVRLP